MKDWGRWLGMGVVGLMALPFLLMQKFFNHPWWQKYESLLASLETKARDPRRGRVARWGYWLAVWLVAIPAIVVALWIIPWPRE